MRAELPAQSKHRFSSTPAKAGLRLFSASQGPRMQWAVLEPGPADLQAALQLQQLLLVQLRPRHLLLLLLQLLLAQLAEALVAAGGLTRFQPGLEALSPPASSELTELAFEPLAII